MKRPSFQFYPTDWLGNSNLKRCSHHERGVWLAVLCLMHDSEEYGILRWPLKDIAQAVGCKISDLKSLEAKGVLKGADTNKQCESFIYIPRHAGKDGDPVTLIDAQDGPLWYSSRMVRDEYVRTNRGIGTRFGGNEDPPKSTPKVSPKPPFGYGASTSTSSSTSNPFGKRGDNLTIPSTSEHVPKTTLPLTFSISKEIECWAKTKGYSEDLPDYLEAFRLKCQANGYQKSNWDSFFKTSMLEDWGKIRQKKYSSGDSNGKKPSKFDPAQAAHDDLKRMCANGMVDPVGDQIFGPLRHEISDGNIFDGEAERLD